MSIVGLVVYLLMHIEPVIIHSLSLCVCVVGPPAVGKPWSLQLCNTTNCTTDNCKSRPRCAEPLVHV